MDKPRISRDDSGRVVQAENDGISGPLGIWPFPILNLIISNSSTNVSVTRINRDDDGRIESIEEIDL